MPYTNDMQTLADVVSPVDAAVQAGTQNYLQNQQDQMRNQVYQAQMPALEQEAGLKNLYTQAQTDLTQGQALGANANGKLQAQLLPSNVQAGIAGNQLKISQDQAEKMSTLGTIANNLASQLDNVAPPARAAYMQNYLKNSGITDPGILQAVGSGDPDQLRNISQKLIQGSAQYQTMLGQETLRAQSAQKVAGITTGGRIQVAETMATARTQVEHMRDQIMQEKQTVDQRIAQLNTRIANGQATDADKAAYSNLQQYSVQLRDYQAQTTRALLNMGDFSPPAGGGQAPSAMPTPSGNQGGTGAGPQIIPATQATYALAQQLWPNDDPSKYDYRQMPDGTLQRKPK